MRIAIPTNDGESLSAHFGRSTAFLVFDVEDGRVVSRDLRANAACGHEAGACGHAGAQAGGHNHDAIVSILEGCGVVLCGGMGRGAADALKAAGISVVPVQVSGPASEIVAAYLAGDIAAAAEALCGCRH